MGVAIGVALPLLLGLIMALYLLRKERQITHPKLMYKPAEPAGWQLNAIQRPYTGVSRNDSSGNDMVQSNQKTYYQNYNYKNPFFSETELNRPVCEIGSSGVPNHERERVEAPNQRFSK